MSVPALAQDAFPPLLAGAESAVVDKFGQEGTVKVRIERSAVTPELLSGGRLVADYGSFVVVEAPAGFGA